MRVITLKKVLVRRRLAPPRQETQGFWGCFNRGCQFMEFCRERKLLPQVALLISSPDTFEVRIPPPSARQTRQLS